MSKPTVKPLSERVRQSEARSINAGAVRMPGGLLSADAALALAELVEAHYADSKTRVIEKALIEANGRRRKTMK